MKLDPSDLTAVTNRIRRAQGQLAGVLAMLEDGRECEDVVTQLAAVSKALDRAGFVLVSHGVRSCLAAGLATGDGPDSDDLKRLEKVFLSLA